MAVFEARAQTLSNDVSTSTDDQSTVRVTNLSEEAQEMDLKELFSHFGQIRRTFLAKDKITQQSKVVASPYTVLLTFMLASTSILSVGICFCEFC